jgi:outer membrane protein TolC
VAILVAQQQLNVTVAEQLHKARLAFYRALYNRSLESLGRAQRQRLEENIAGEQARYTAGQSERGALTSATLLARELDPKIESAHNSYGGAILELAQSMGSPLGVGATLPSPEGTLQFRTTNLHWRSEVERALQDRADLKLARLLVRAAGEEQRMIASDYYPAIEAIVAGDAIPVTGIYRDSGGSPQATDNTVANEFAAGAAYTCRVIDNGKVGGAVARQRTLRDTNELELKKLEANIPSELARLQNNLEAIAARYGPLLGAAEVAEGNVKSVEENRAQGLASVLDFRTAESDLLVTRRGILTAVYEQNVALAEWDRATGRYFQFCDNTTAKGH